MLLVMLIILPIKWCNPNPSFKIVLVEFGTVLIVLDHIPE